MTKLTGGFKKLLGKSTRMKRASGGGVSTSSGATGSVYSRDSVEDANDRTSFDTASSVYSRTTSACDSPRPLGEVLHGIKPASRISWLDGIVHNPYGYSVHETEQTDQEQRSHGMTTAFKNSLHTKPPPSPPGYEPQRASAFASPVCLSRQQSVSVHPEGTPQTDVPAEHIQNVADAVEGITLTDAIESNNEDDKLIAETKWEIRLIKLLDVNLTRNALHMAHQAFEVGCSTLQILQEHGERLHQAGAGLMHAAGVNEDSAQKLKELKQANRLVRVVKGSGSSKREVDNAGVSASRRGELGQRDRVRAANWHAWKESKAHRFVGVPLHRGATHRDILARAKYQFEDDSDDERIEDIIEDNVNELIQAVRGLKGLALATSVELAINNDALERTKRAADTVDDGLARNGAALERIV